MKRREMNSLARSLCAYLSSRNNDIAGYWGIGMLCAASKRQSKPKFSFKIYPGQLIRVYGCEITDSKLVKFDLVSIEVVCPSLRMVAIRTEWRSTPVALQSPSHKAGAPD